ERRDLHPAAARDGGGGEGRAQVDAELVAHRDPLKTVDLTLAARQYPCQLIRGGSCSRRAETWGRPSTSPPGAPGRTSSNDSSTRTATGVTPRRGWSWSATSSRARARSSTRWWAPWPVPSTTTSPPRS